MEDEWDADSFQPPPVKPQGDKWEGEDEDDDVKDNWEDEEEEKKDEEKQEDMKPTLPVVKKKKTLSEKIVEKELKEKELIARKLAAKEAMKNLSPEEKLAEKLRQQRLQEEADLQVTKETFGVAETSDSIDALQPTTQEEFNLLEEALMRKLQLLVSSVHYPNFIENLLRNIGAGLNSSNLKKLKLTIENLITEKTKVEKGPTKKGTSKAKPRVRLEQKNDFSAFGADDMDDWMD